MNEVYNLGKQISHSNESVLSLRHSDTENINDYSALNLPNFFDSDNEDVFGESDSLEDMLALKYKKPKSGNTSTASNLSIDDLTDDNVDELNFSTLSISCDYKNVNNISQRFYNGESMVLGQSQTRTQSQINSNTPAERSYSNAREGSPKRSYSMKHQYEGPIVAVTSFCQ